MRRCRPDTDFALVVHSNASRTVAVESIRCRRQFLARRECLVSTCFTALANTDFQPKRIALEDVVAEVQWNGKKAVVDRFIISIDRACYHAAGRRVVVERELEVIVSIGRETGVP